MSVKFTIVPSQFTSAGIESPDFDRSKFYNIKREEHARLENFGAIVCLDKLKRIWRWKGLALSPDSVKVRTTRISRAVGWELRQVMASEIRRTPMLEEIDAAI